jgi:hypothetical protein
LRWGCYKGNAVPETVYEAK